jgi:hypothetical protein
MPTSNLVIDRAVAQAVSRWLPTAAARVRVQAACAVCGGQSGTGAGFSPRTSVSPANHSTNFSIIIITRGGHNRPISGRSAEWTQLDSTPPLYQLKKPLVISQKPRICGCILYSDLGAKIGQECPAKYVLRKQIMHTHCHAFSYTTDPDHITFQPFFKK